MKWESKNTYNTIDELISARELIVKDSYALKAVTKQGLTSISKIIDVLNKGMPIYAIGDYDVDGISAIAELELIAQKKGWNMKYRLPKRFSEGYGLSTKIVDEIPEGILITVDNGIAAHEAIAKAKKKGLYVIVTDHHLTVKNPDGTDNLPEADIILNPHIARTCDFEHYCGAGIVYKMAEYMFPNDEEFLNQLSAYAAIATIADCVPLVEDNRKIVIKGFDAIMNAKKTTGLTALLAMSEAYFRPLLINKKVDGKVITERKAPEKNSYVIMKLKTGEYITGYYARFDKFLNPNKKVVVDTDIELWAYSPKELSNAFYLDEMTVGYKIAPMLNAPGRLYDDGATRSLELITFDGPMNEAVILATKLYADNECRKVLVDEGMLKLESLIKSRHLENNYPLCIYDENLHEGIIGILAGKILEKYKVPTIVFTNCNGQLKGSARSNTSLNIKELLDKHSNLLLKYGGHPEAAGLSIREMDFKEFDFALRNSVTRPASNDVISYDLAINEEEIPEVIAKINTLKPFGEGNGKPVFKINKFQLVPDIFRGDKYRICQEGRSIILNGKNSSAIGFELNALYQSIVKNPLLNEDCLNVIGTLNENHFNGRVTPQIEMIDFKA